MCVVRCVVGRVLMSGVLDVWSVCGWVLVLNMWLGVCWVYDTECVVFSVCHWVCVVGYVCRVCGVDYMVLGILLDMCC